MPETQDQKKSQDLISLLKEYISTRVEIARLSAIEQVTIVVANLITDTFVAVMAILTFLFASITLGLFLGELMDSYAAGFGIVTLIYLALALVMLFTKDKLVEGYLHDFMVKRIFNKKK